MKVGDIIKHDEITLINYELCFVQFCELGSNGVNGCYSLTFKELENGLGGLYGFTSNHKRIERS